MQVKIPPAFAEFSVPEKTIILGLDVRTHARIAAPHTATLLVQPEDYITRRTRSLTWQASAGSNGLIRLRQGKRYKRTMLPQANQAIHFNQTPGLNTYRVTLV
jgi:hypothetical protein